MSSSPGRGRDAVAGYWPDPLPPLKGAVDLEAGKNQPFGLVKVRAEACRDG
jgi:hypothetical protein